MNKQELIKKIKDISLGAGDHGDTKNEHESEYALIAYILDLVNRLDEPQKVKVPAFVAEWISKCRELNWILPDLLAPEAFESNFARDTEEWLRQDKQNYDILARAWLDGYEVEEEPKYYLDLPKIGMVNEFSNNQLNWTNCEGGITENAIKSIDERYWPFAVPVEKV